MDWFLGDIWNREFSTLITGRRSVINSTKIPHTLLEVPRETVTPFEAKALYSCLRCLRSKDHRNVREGSILLSLVLYSDYFAPTREIFLELAQTTENRIRVERNVTIDVTKVREIFPPWKIYITHRSIRSGTFFFLQILQNQCFAKKKSRDLLNDVLCKIYVKVHKIYFFPKVVYLKYISHIFYISKIYLTCLTHTLHIFEWPKYIFVSKCCVCRIYISFSWGFRAT